MPASFENKVALVTGGTSGIGEVTAIAFAKAGARVALTGRRADKGAAVVDAIKATGGEALFIQSDISDTIQVESMVAKTVDHFGGLHVAFNNAGLEGVLAPVIEQTDENYDAVMNANVRGVLNSMKFEVPAILKSGGGAIVNNSSIAGLIGMAGLGVYCASKHAVIGLTKCAALEYSKEGVRVNAVCPAAIETDMYDRFTGGDADAVAYFTSLHPIGRVGKSQEIANTVLWLCSDESSFVTGQSLAVDGAFTAQQTPVVGFALQRVYDLVPGETPTRDTILVDRLKSLAKVQDVLLLYSARNEEQNQAVVLLSVLENG